MHFFFFFGRNAGIKEPSWNSDTPPPQSEESLRVGNQKGITKKRIFESMQPSVQSAGNPAGSHTTIPLTGKSLKTRSEFARQGKESQSIRKSIETSIKEEEEEGREGEGREQETVPRNKTWN